jgi:hypothetical protein
MLTRGVCRAMPRFFATACADVTMPRAMSPCPPSFSLANTKTVSPAAISLPPYMVFCAVKMNALVRGSRISALIANAMRHPPRRIGQRAARPRQDVMRRTADDPSAAAAAGWLQFLRIGR